MKIDNVKLRAMISKKQAENPDLRIRDIADAAGFVAERRVYQLMAGKSTTINPRIGEAIAKKLGCKVSEIIA